MKYVYSLLWLTGLVILQSTLLPVVFPWLPLAPAFVFLVVVSLRLERRFFLIAALWTGLVQDILLGEFLGLFMLLNFISAALIWEIKNELLDNLVLTGGLRLIAATLIQEILMAFIFYIRGRANLGSALQINAGINLLSNLLLYILFMFISKLLRRRDKLEAVLEAKL
ncbi:MAG: rod shape-determining protein MreD [Eubacteriales bacterium]|jgi:rod shape-determining protein MreD|nr:rod shape-determining protein MreD [Eubacteriales bacterium]